MPSASGLMSPQDVSLRDFLLKIMDERDLRFEARFEALSSTQKESMESAEKAILKAEAANEKRFSAINEFRGQLADQQGTFVRKTEVDIRFEALEKKLDVALTQLQLTKSRDTGMSTFGAALGIVVGILVSIGA